DRTVRRHGNRTLSLALPDQLEAGEERRVDGGPPPRHGLGGTHARPKFRGRTRARPTLLTVRVPVREDGRTATGSGGSRRSPSGDRAWPGPLAPRRDEPGSRRPECRAFAGGTGTAARARTTDSDSHRRNRARARAEWTTGTEPKCRSGKTRPI